MEQNGNARHTPAEGAGGQTLAAPAAANDTMPTAEERAEMRALDAKLDALAAKLKG
jgi:hypothetical protein